MSSPSPSQHNADDKKHSHSFLLGRRDRRGGVGGGWELRRAGEERKEMRPWKELGLVETIYEEEHEDISNSPSLTPSTATSPSPPQSSSSSLRCRVEEWVRATGCRTDVVVHVHDRCFHLHKERLASRSGYLRRRLTESPAVTVSPPLPIDAETFAAVAAFCYGADVAVTPFNVAPIRVAAELLEMAEEEDDDGGGGGWSLVERTEGYFRRAVCANPEYAAVVLQTCLGLLPEAERTASLASRCVEALALADGGGGGWLEDVASLGARDFQMIADSMRERSLRSHDALYRIVDYYLQNHAGKLTEEEKARICYSVDSKRLSPRLLVHLIQNPRMPLRFIVQAMLVEQLLTRRAIFDRARKARADLPGSGGGGGVTLGSILQRDATLRQAAHLRASMQATSSRIQTLERDLANMKRRLPRSQQSTTSETDAEMEMEVGSEPARSASCRFFGPEERADVRGWVPAMRSCSESPRNGKTLGQMLVNGFRTVFRRTRLGSAASGVDRDSADRVVQENNPRCRQTHRRHHSFA